jgi:hypothetical protein
VARGGGVVLALPGGLPGSRRSLLASFACLFGVVLGLALVAPAFTVGLMALVGPAASRLLGPIGRLATGTVARALAAPASPRQR